MLLHRFGFTPTESRVYISLVTLGTTTGYAVARSVGVARANVYQALEGLCRRGAATKSPGSPAHYTALAPNTLLRALDHELRRDLNELEAELSRLATAPSSPPLVDQPSAIRSADALLEIACQVADQEDTELLVVTGPWANGLNAAVDRARRRQVSVLALALGEPAPVGAVLREMDGAALAARWGGLPMLVVGAGGRAVLGTLAADGKASGAAVDQPGVLAFLRHLVKRELASGGALSA